MQLAKALEQLPEKLWLVTSSAVTSSWSWARWSELTYSTFILCWLPKPPPCARCWGFTGRGKKCSLPAWSPWPGGGHTESQPVIPWRV